MSNDFKNNRREFLKTTGKAGLAAGLSFTVLPSLAEQYQSANPFSIGADDILYTQQPLPYSYDALQPSIDSMTMEIHYSKHAATYAKNLADAATAEKVDTTKIPLTDLLKKISKYSVKMRNNAGGHYNHELFWKTMKSPGSATSAPTGSLLSAIEKNFTSLDAFKTQFADAAKNRFGSGWAWLVKTSDKKLVIASTPNQDNPLMDLPAGQAGVSEAKGYPLLGLDVWEHAYYLKYQNKRPDYITNWWAVVNWDAVQKRFDAK
jgi:superoxide dismutase, Fe-Mn family